MVGSLPSLLLRPLLVAQERRLIPTHDADVFLYAAGGVFLLVVGGLLIYFTRRNDDR